MLDPPSSPTISSISSSDLDTESTGSFFHDRSTTLGTLMGVNFPALPVPPFRPPSQHSHRESSGPSTRRHRKNTAAERRMRRQRQRRWWRLCRDDGTRPAASLGEFLDLERRCGDGAVYAAELEGSVVVAQQQEGRNGRVLFADGRVLPPAGGDGVDDGKSVFRFPVLLTGICSGGVG